jgi:hypothetical protein
LNAKETRKLVSGTDFKLEMGQATLVDLLLKELVNMRGGAGTTSQAASAVDGPALRVVIENPQQLQAMTFGFPGATPKSPKESHRKGSDNQNAKNKGIANNESMKDSVFQQSGQAKKQDQKRRDLESINEGAESKIIEDDFHSNIKDDNMFSLSISQTQGPQRGGAGANKGKPNNPSQLAKKEVDEQSYGADFDSYVASGGGNDLSISRPIKSPRQGPSGPSPQNQLQSQQPPAAPPEKTIQCFNCRKAIPISKLQVHLPYCMRPDKKDQHVPNESMKLRASASQDIYKDSFPEDIPAGSVSKSSMMKKSGRLVADADKDVYQRTESRVRTEYEDDFEHITERSELTSEL